MNRLINKYFTVIVFILAAATSTAILCTGFSYKLFGIPPVGTDQLTMLKAAAGIYHGQMPSGDYFYSPSYTIFLYLLTLVTHGQLFFMRLLQGISCAFVPVMIYKLCRAVRINRQSSQIAALIYCFYGPAALLSVAMLRAIPLALCFILTAYFIIRGFTGKSLWKYITAGFFAGMCILGRENFLPVVFAPVAMLLFKDIRNNLKYKHGIAYFLAILIPLAPVLIYNLAVHGAFSIVPGHMNNILGGYHGEKAVADHSLAIKSIISNIPRQLYLFTTSFELENSVNFYSHRDVISFMWILIIPYNLILALAVIPLWWRRRNRGIILIALFALAYVSTMIYFDLYSRYRIPIVPLLVVLAGAGLGYLISQRKLIQIAPPLILAIIIFAITWSNPNPQRRPGERFAVANVFIQNKQYSRAADYLKKLDNEGLDTRRAKIQLIRILHNAGRQKEAEAIYLDMVKNEKQRKSKSN